MPLVPRPKLLEPRTGAFAIDRTTRITVDEGPDAHAVAERLARWLSLPNAIDLLPRGAPEPSRGIVLRLEGGAPRDPSVHTPKSADDEAYVLDIDGTRALLRAKSAAGLFYGAQTIAQLADARRIGQPNPAPARPLPCVHIEDAPAYPFRAMHLDVARHFFDVAEVERYIDLLSFYRFNVFHFHLTDDQGFRIEIARHPELTQVGGKDGFFTHGDARAVIDFAKERFVTVVPELELPGHVRAILAAHPELSCTGKKQDVPKDAGIYDDVLCAGNEASYALVDELLADIVKTFPSHLVHVGGDEVPRTRWNACPKCRAKMAKEKLGPDALQGGFMKRASATLARLGRRPLAWDEALDAGLPPDGIIVAWQGPERGALAMKANHDVVFAPHQTCYFNIWQSKTGTEPGHEGFVPWTRVRAFDPGTGPHVLGGEGTLWTEHIANREQIDTMVMPRMAALAEALWTGAANVSEADFAARFTAQRPALDDSNVKYFVEPPVGVQAKTVFLEGEETTLAIVPPSLFPDGVVRVTTDGSAPSLGTPPFVPRTTKTSIDVAAQLFLPRGRTSPVIRGRWEAQAPKPSYQGPTFSGVKYTYYEADVHRLPKFGDLKPKRTGTLPGIVLDPSFRKNGFAVRYESFFLAARDAVYRFTARGDDGVRVLVDGALVVEDDGEHAARDVSGDLALGKGPHKVEVEFFQSGGGMELSVLVSSGNEAPAAPILR